MIPIEALEAAAKAVAVTIAGDADTHPNKEDRTLARAALEAAAPHMLAAAWEEGYMCSYDQERGGTGEGTIPAPEYLADDLAQWNPYRPTNAE